MFQQNKRVCYLFIALTGLGVAACTGEDSLQSTIAEPDSIEQVVSDSESPQTGFGKTDPTIISELDSTKTSTTSESTSKSGSIPETAPAKKPATELEPVAVSTKKFSEILNEYKDGGVIVIPDGTYIGEDIINLNPSKPLVVIAESRNGVIVTRKAKEIGKTSFALKNSSNITFAGIYFKDVLTNVSGSNKIEFRNTKHSYPISAHPDPSETYCGNQTGPDAVHINGGSEDISFYGVDIIGVGHDSLKLSSSNRINFIGSVISDSDHGSLQNGRGNARCGWDGDDNYHNDGIQIYPGAVNNLVVRDSYIGRRVVLQVDNNGSSNNGIKFVNNWFYAEPPIGSCLSADMRVKASAKSGATMDVTMQGNKAYCANNEWSFFLGGSRDNSMTINGDKISSTEKNGSKYFENIIGIPDLEKSPAHIWRANNTYESWLDLSL